MSANEQKRSSWLGAAVKTALSVGMIVIVFYQAGFRQTMDSFRKASAFWLMLALLVYLAGVFVRALRWQGLLAALGVRLGLGRLSWLYFIGFFFNQLVPTGVGGDAMRAYTLAKDGAGGTLAANSVVMDRATGLYSLLVMGALAVIWQPALASNRVALLLIGLTLGITVGTMLFLWSARAQLLERLPAFARNRFLKIFNKFYNSFGSYSAASIARALTVSVFFNIQLIITNIFLAKAFGVEISVWYFFLFVPIISLSLLAPTINGMGSREFAYVFLFGQAGVLKSQALAMSLSFYGLNLVMALVGGLMLVVQSLQRTPEAGIDAEVAAENNK